MKTHIFILLLATLTTICSSHLAKRHRLKLLAAKEGSKRRLIRRAVPVVLWHGMGDCCCNPMSMGAITRLIEKNVNGIYVKSLMLGENIASDTERGFFANMNELVELACAQIRNDSLLSQGYNAVGFSQGGQFLRAVAERCPSPPMRNLISVGGQQQGVFGLPYCPGDTIVCNTIRKLLDMGAYTSYVQNNVVQAQYWHDPMHEDDYRSKNIFLADINNEKNQNKEYKKNLLYLKNLVLIKFLRDQLVIPKESSWFGYYKENDLDTILPINETRLYKEYWEKTPLFKDLIGLRKLDETNRLHFVAVDGQHLQIPPEVFEKEVIEKYLK
uniref:Palmitoyl-protein thioesterase 1 n=1 Tax=Heterorhabditis bacteriophora TaxID=37862 RepID=A0A1I7XIK0_HETBA